MVYPSAIFLPTAAGPISSPDSSSFVEVELHEVAMGAYPIQAWTYTSQNQQARCEQGKLMPLWHEQLTQGRPIAHFETKCKTPCAIPLSPAIDDISSGPPWYRQIPTKLQGHTLVYGKYADMRAVLPIVDPLQHELLCIYISQVPQLACMYQPSFDRQ